MEESISCRHDLRGVEPNKGWYECKICGTKIRGAEAKAILHGDYSELPEGISRIGGKTINKKLNGEVSVINSPEYNQGPELITPESTVKKDPVTLSSGVTTVGSTITIKCIDCGAERVIKVQDEFQVKRCVACQKKFRNKKRSTKRKSKEAIE